jgi:hypothetical protein
VSGETERLIELAGELGRRVNGALRDVIPPEAQDHLFKAQKELLTALFLIYEHQVTRRPNEVPAARSAPRSRARARPGDRVQRIDIE